MYEDSYLDGFMEDHLNGGGGHILDAQHEQEAFDASIDPVFGDEDEWPDEDEWYDEADPGWADGDHETGLASAGFGTDEDYGMFDCDNFADDCPF